MKLTEENKELIYMTKNGTFRYGHATYVYGGKCKNCEGYFLTLKSRMGNFCCLECRSSGKYNPNFNKVMSVEQKQKISNTRMGRYTGGDNPNYKGGVTDLDIALYDTYVHQLPPNFEKVRIYMLRIGCVVYKTFQVKCNGSDCTKWFRPTRVQVDNRLQSFKGNYTSSNNFYCSDKCKLGCSTYRQIKYFKDQQRESYVCKYENRKRNQTPILTKSEKLKIKTYYKVSKYMGKGWQVDHVVPLNKGGLHYPDNLQVVPTGHNARKMDNENYQIPDHETFKLDNIRGD